MLTVNSTMVWGRDEEELAAIEGSHPLNNPFLAKRISNDEVIFEVNSESSSILTDSYLKFIMETIIKQVN